MNQFYEVSRLEITTKYKDNKTVMDDIFCTAPYKVAKPFSVKNGGIVVLVMMASAGIFEGDQYNVVLNIEEYCKLYFTTQSYEKVFKMNSGSALRNTSINVKNRAELIYFPMPVIPFADSEINNNFNINLEGSEAKLSFVDIISCGRKARGEIFKYKQYTNKIKIFEENNIVFFDNSKFIPEENNIAQIGMMGEYSHLATLIFCNYGKDKLAESRDILKQYSDISSGASQINDRICVVKILGQNADKLVKICNNLVNMPAL